MKVERRNRCSPFPAFLNGFPLAEVDRVTKALFPPKSLFKERYRQNFHFFRIELLNFWDTHLFSNHLKRVLASSSLFISIQAVLFKVKPHGKDTESQSVKGFRSKEPSEVESKVKLGETHPFDFPLTLCSEKEMSPNSMFNPASLAAWRSCSSVDHCWIQDMKTRSFECSKEKGGRRKRAQSVNRGPLESFPARSLESTPKKSIFG